MLDKISNISKSLAFFGFALYFLGFLTLTSYLARFGIITFDIVNARFLIAGMLCAVSLAVVVYFAWLIYTTFSSDTLFSVVGWKKRLLNYAAILFLIHGVSLGLTLLFNSGKYEPPTNRETLIFKPLLGSNDLVGKVVDKINSNNIPINYTLKIWAYFLVVISFIFVVLLISMAVRQLIKKFRPEKFYKAVPASDELTAKPNIPATVEKVDKPTPKGIQRLGIVFLESCLLALNISIYIFCYKRIKVALFDFNSFPDEFTLTTGLIFAWIYGSTSAILFFLYLSKIPKNPDLDFLKKVLREGNISIFLYQLLIPVVAAIFLFGATVFPRISYTIGGGLPREVIISYKEEGFAAGENISTYLLGESNSSYFIVEKALHGQSHAKQLSKEIVNYIVTKKENTSN